MDVADLGHEDGAEVFVAVLGASGMLYAEATRGQDLASWVGAHVHAWAFYGGVAEVTVPDYAPRRIIRVLFPTALCGRGRGNGVITAVNGPMPLVAGT